MDYILGLDNGLTTIKAVLFDIEGKEVERSEDRWESIHSKLGWAERDMNIIWLGTKRVIQRVISKAKIDPKEIQAIGITGHGNGVFLLDKKGQPVREGILSLDLRATEIVNKWKSMGVCEEIYPISRQAIMEGQPPALMRWIKENEPENYKRARWILLSKDWLKYKLTGVICTDETDAGACNLMDITQKRYESKLFEYFQIEECVDKLPKIIPSWEICGEVTTAAANETGLKEGTPVVSGSIDTAACAFGVGALEVGTLVIITGTWGINELIIDQPVLCPEVCMVDIYGAPGRWVAIDASATSTNNLDWFIKEFCYKEKREAERRGISVYSICDSICEEEIKKIESEECNVIYHPFLYGSNIQGTARAGFYGIGGWHSKENLLRAVYEGVVFCHYNHIEKLNKIQKVGTAWLLGGGARSEPWCQIFSDVTGLEIKVPGIKEVGARGAALSAGIGVGIYKDHRVASSLPIPIKRVYQFSQANREKYLKKYGVYKKLITQMSGVWKEMYQISKKEK